MLPKKSLAESWLKRAKSNLARAKQSKIEDAVWEDYCFDAQQAAEKAIKAILIKRNIKFRFVHDIGELLTTLSNAGVVIPIEVEDAVALTVYAVESRYPGPFEEITEDEYLEAIKIAIEVVSWAQSEIDKTDTDKNLTTFTFKKLSNEDIQLLLSWFKEPHVSEWWPTPDEDEAIIEKFLVRIRSEDTFGFIVSLNDTPIGYIQYYHYDHAVEKAGSWWPSIIPKTSVGSDQFIGDPNYVGKGFGNKFIKEFILYLKNIEPDVTTLIVDPDPTNKRAIRCYEKVGFKMLGEYHAPWGDACLMCFDLHQE
ncbi:MAG: GNAT family N-acetyltransferase [Oligoflexia bacterium]|nr:GNAT family N-acetyltransferase [Oligoflexia bacterium]